MNNRRLILASSAALTNAFTVGIASTYSSTATESMKLDLKPTEDEISWIGSILSLGAIIGGLCAGYLSDRLGRKGVMVILSIILLIGWLMIAFAGYSLPMVYAGRFLTGFWCGLVCVVTPMYVVEISTPEIRGNLGSRFQLFICFGIIIASVAGKYLTWQWFAIVGAIVGVLSLLCMLPLPESPRWLVMHNKHSDAVHAVNSLYGNTTDPSVNQLISESLGSTMTTSTIAPHEIMHPTFYLSAVLSILLMFFQQFSGSNAILYYTVSIFKQASASMDPTLGNLLVACVMFFFTLLTSQTMDTLGRKKSLYISGIFTGLSLLGMGVFSYLSSKTPSLKETYGWIPLMCLLIYIAAFSIGLGPIPWLMMSEMAPARGRSLICGLGTAFSWIFVFIITKTFLKVESQIGDYGAYWIYAVFCFISCFFTFFFLPETKGKTMEEIANYFSRGESQINPLPTEPVSGILPAEPVSEILPNQIF